MRLRYLIAGFLIGIVISAAGLGRAHRLSGHPSSLRGKLLLAKAQVRHDRLELRARHWLLLSPTNQHRVWLARDIRNLRHLQRLLTPAAGPSWLVNAFLCIHRGEGSWTDPNPPYFGGLQMDYSFMAAYGGSLLRSKGTADHWTPAEQISVAIRAYLSGRGFYPWPNTARACGLLP